MEDIGTNLDQDFLENLDEVLASNTQSFNPTSLSTQGADDSVNYLAPINDIETIDERLELFQFLEHQTSVLAQVYPATEFVPFSELILQEAIAAKKSKSKDSLLLIATGMAVTSAESSPYNIIDDPNEEYESPSPSPPLGKAEESQHLAPTPVIDDTLNNIEHEHMLKRRELIKILIKNSLVANKEPLEELTRAEKRSSSLSDPSNSSLASAASLAERREKREIEVLDKYTKNIPVSFTPKEMDKIIWVSEKRYDPNSLGESIHGLEEIGFFNDKSLLLSYRLVENPYFMARSFTDRIQRFLEYSVNIVLVCIIGRIFPFTLDLNDISIMTQMYQGVLGTLRDIVKAGAKEKTTTGKGGGNNQIKLAFKRAIQSWVKENGATSLEMKKGEESFYNMKDNQNIENLSVDSFYFRDEARCPLFTKYGRPKFVGAGAYGFVIRYFANFPDKRAGLLEQYAIKVQRITTEELKKITTPAYVELRLLHEINRFASHWPKIRRIKPFGHVHLHDWVRCQFNPKNRFLALMGDKEKEKYEEFMVDEEGIYQVIVEEFATGGTLHDILTANEASFGRYASEKALMSLFIQVFGHLNALGKEMQLSHKDMKPANILVQPTEPDTPIKYLVYNNPSIGKLYVPLEDSNYCIYKVSDFGRGRAEIHRIVQVENEKKKGSFVAINKTEIIGTTKTAAYNPAHDVENTLLMFFSLVLKTYKSKITKKLTNDILDLVQSGIHKGAASMADERARYDYDKVLTFLRDLKENEEAITNADPEDLQSRIASVKRSIDRIYSEHLWEWEDKPSVSDLNAFDTIFSHNLFSTYTVKPKDLTSENHVVMDDYIEPF